MAMSVGGTTFRTPGRHDRVACAALATMAHLRGQRSLDTRGIMDLPTPAASPAGLVLQAAHTFAGQRLFRRARVSLS